MPYCSLLVACKHCGRREGKSFYSRVHAKFKVTCRPCSLGKGRAWWASEKSQQSRLNKVEKQKIADAARYKKRWEEDPAVTLYKRVKQRANIRGVEFDLPEPLPIPDICPVLGVKLLPRAGRGGGSAPSSPSYDRFDNTRGYVVGNVRVISCRANVIKRDASPEELRLVSEYANGEK